MTVIHTHRWSNGWLLHMTKFLLIYAAAIIAIGAIMYYVCTHTAPYYPGVMVIGHSSASHLGGLDQQ